MSQVYSNLHVARHRQKAQTQEMDGNVNGTVVHRPCALYGRKTDAEMDALRGAECSLIKNTGRVAST